MQRRPPPSRPSRNLSSNGEYRGVKSDAGSSGTVPCPVSAPVRTKDGAQDTLHVSAHPHNRSVEQMALAFLDSVPCPGLSTSDLSEAVPASTGVRKMY